MAYRCDQAVTGAAREPIRCKVSGSVCAHQKMCMMEGRIVLTDGAMRCPGRDGRLPDPEPEKKAKAGTDGAEAKDAEAAGTAGKTPVEAGTDGAEAKDAEAPAKKEPVKKTGTETKSAKAPAKKTPVKTAGAKGAKAPAKAGKA